MVKYYYAGSTRVAMRRGANTLYWLLSDHLGSQAITADANGGDISEVRYMPWGEERYYAYTSSTTYRYTGQRMDFGSGLYFYNARWYDPLLARFIQADTIVPGGVQGLDRYAYTKNNPVKYIDPSGHDPEYIKGWKDEYLQQQNGNTCAVVSVAVVLSIEKGYKVTQNQIQPTFPLTYFPTKENGIGVPPSWQAAGLNEYLRGSGEEAVYTHGNKTDILNNLLKDCPVIMTIALPGNAVGHAIVAIGYDPNTGQIWFFNPATGTIQSESKILNDYDFGRGYKSFEDLWGASNLVIASNSMVVIENDTGPTSIVAPPQVNGGAGNNSRSNLCMQ